MNKTLAAMLKVGDVVLGDGSVIPGHNKLYCYSIVSITPTERFGKPDYLLEVDVYAVSRYDLMIMYQAESTTDVDMMEQLKEKLQRQLPIERTKRWPTHLV